MPKKRWDRHAIVAEIRRRGTSLRQLSRDAGEPDCTCSQAMRQGYPKGEKIVADFLGVPKEELWPDRYPEASASSNNSAERTRESSQKRATSADIGVAA